MNVNRNSLLGRTADITIDRQLGSRNIRHRNITYSIQLGHFAAEKKSGKVKHLIYIIGAENTSNTFKGTIICTIKRSDTNQLLLVAAPEGKHFYEVQIRECLGFFEKQYKSDYEFYMTKSCGIILYRIVDDAVQFLVSRDKKSGRISLIKGGIEFGESEKETAVREVLEKTGICAEISDDFRSEYVFGTSEHTREKSVFFMAEYGDVMLKTPEKSDYVLSAMTFEEAVRSLDYPQEIILLMEARDYYEQKRKSMRSDKRA